MSNNVRWVLLALCFPLALFGADRIDQLTIDRLAADYLAKRATSALPPDIDMAEALNVQDKLVSKLTTQMGGVAGYKVGLVTREAQERAGVNHPIRGVLLSQMLLSNNAEVGIDYGVKPLVEADLIVVVRDRAINRATTLMEVAINLKEIVAFMELPDSYIATNQRVTGAVLTAANVGARLGVLGERTPVQATEEFINSLAAMRITLSDGTGKELGRATGDVILRNPLNAVIWLVAELQKTGKKLNPGDYLSLGSIKAVTPLPGQTYTAKYEGLPGGPISVSVKFKSGS
ncbi:MAG: hypothetical protein L0Y58_12545 [Verrucomicrobia subdivision 3 bacterium]|nr:hypothetical protein [Limisphaerales bacterium]